MSTGERVWRCLMGGFGALLLIGSFAMLFQACEGHETRVSYKSTLEKADYPTQEPTFVWEFKGITLYKQQVEGGWLYIATHGHGISTEYVADPCVK